jgi:hypothetical protein
MVSSIDVVHLNLRSHTESHELLRNFFNMKLSRAVSYNCSSVWNAVMEVLSVKEHPDFYKNNG